MKCLDRSDHITCKQMNNENVIVGSGQNIDVLCTDTYPPSGADMITKVTTPTGIYRRMSVPQLRLWSPVNERNLKQK